MSSLSLPQTKTKPQVNSDTLRRLILAAVECRRRILAIDAKYQQAVRNG